MSVDLDIDKSSLQRVLGQGLPSQTMVIKLTLLYMNPDDNETNKTNYIVYLLTAFSKSEFLNYVKVSICV